MKPKEKIKVFLIAFISFTVLDFIWLGYVVKDFNLAQLAQLGRIENGNFSILYGPALIVYVLMSLGVLFYIFPKIEKKGIPHSFAYGALMGLIVYGVYDMTNLSILSNYPVAFAIADMAWGTFAFGAVSAIVRKLS